MGRLRFAYLGPAGTFSEEAARKYQKRTWFEQHVVLCPERNIQELLYAVHEGKYEYGIVPVENSIEGSVVITLDMLVHEVDLQIVGEEVLSVEHHLLAKPNVKLEHIQRILSHPQALAQCRHSLGRLGLDAEMQAANSTAEAAKLVSENNEPWAAIGTELAAKIYGLKTLAKEIQDAKNNATRFLIVGRKKAAATGVDKTSIVLAFPKDKPGNLAGVLQQFASAGINLTKLESRPAKRSLGDYLFFIDLEGHRADANVKETLRTIEPVCALFRVLGSYPRIQYERP